MKLHLTHTTFSKDTILFTVSQILSKIIQDLDELYKILIVTLSVILLEVHILLQKAITENV